MNLERKHLLATDVRQFSDVNIYLLACLFANLFFLIADGYGGDIDYWREWMRQIQHRGYAGFEGNYPPVYIHWLWICSKLAFIFDLTLDAHMEVKALAVIPVVLMHLLLVRVVYALVHAHTSSPEKRKFIIWWTALNPVILVDGPMWGQIDLFPSAIVAISLLAAHSSRYFIFVVPLYSLALLTKFQMIAFAPVFGFIFFRRFTRSLFSLVLAVVLTALLLLPFVFAGNLIEVLDNAYLKTLGQYPFATMYAANIWMVFYGNMQPDSTQVLPFLFGEAASIKVVGMLLFSILSIAVFAKGCHLVYQERKGRDASALDQYIWHAALICSFGFFIVLPGMHERYLFAACIIAIFFVIRADGSLPLALLITLCALLNILIVLPLRGDELWKPLAFTSCIIFAVFTFNSFWPKTSSKLLGLRYRWTTARCLPEFLLLCASLAPIMVEKYLIWADEAVRTDEVRLTDLRPVSARQDWGGLKFNKTVSEEVFSVGQKKFRHGLGTHANSKIEYALDKKYEVFRFRVGVNEDSKDGSMRFEVYGDGQLIWQSREMSGGDIEGEVALNVGGVLQLALVVDSLGSINSDHANWLNPVLKRTGP